MSEFDWLPSHVERGAEAKPDNPVVVALKVAALLIIGGLIVIGSVLLAGKS